MVVVVKWIEHCGLWGASCYTQWLVGGCNRRVRSDDRSTVNNFVFEDLRFHKHLMADRSRDRLSRIHQHLQPSSCMSTDMPAVLAGGDPPPPYFFLVQHLCLFEVHNWTWSFSMSWSGSVIESPQPGHDFGGLELSLISRCEYVRIVHWSSPHLLLDYFSSQIFLRRKCFPELSSLMSFVLSKLPTLSQLQL